MNELPGIKAMACRNRAGRWSSATQALNLSWLAPMIIGTLFHVPARMTSNGARGRRLPPITGRVITAFDEAARRMSSGDFDCRHCAAVVASVQPAAAA